MLRITMSLLTIGMVVAMSSAMADNLDDNWYMAHVDEKECVPLHDIDVRDVGNPVSFGDFARTPEAFVTELKGSFGPTARSIKLEMKSPDMGVVTVDATPGGFQTVLIRGLDLCHGLMERVRSRK